MAGTFALIVALRDGVVVPSLSLSTGVCLRIRQPKFGHYQMIGTGNGLIAD